MSRDDGFSPGICSSNIRRLLGAPPSLSRDAIAKSIQTERDNETSNGTECSGDESDTAKTADETEGEAKQSQHDDEEGNATPTPSADKRQKRKKRRIHLTAQGLKAKRKAERREKLMADKKNEVQDDNSSSAEALPGKSSPPSLVNEKELLKEPPQQKVKPSPNTFTPFQLLCDNLIRKFMAKDPEQYFTHPVTEMEAPGYHSIVECPMAFSTIQEKIDTDAYSNLEQFKADIALISDNAMLYNSASSIYYLAAQKLTFLAKYYFSEKYLLFLFYSLPFGKDLTEDNLGIRLSRKEKQHPSDDPNVQGVLSSAPVKIKELLTKRRPCQIAYLDTKEGAFALNILTATTGPTLADRVKPLGRGNPGVCAPFEPRMCSDYLISYTSPGPFASFAPHFDMTWATMSKRDSDLLLSCYGDRDNVADAVALRQMALNSGTMASDLVESILNDLTENEHSKTHTVLENIDDGEMFERPSSVGHRLHKTGKMIEELASMQHHRLSKSVQPTLSAVTKPEENEVHLAEDIVQELGQHVVQLGAKPGDLIQSPSLHQAHGLDVDDYNVLSEFLDV